MNESGRSMIEMLGVLAIIGVLSVGGIAGYSKAMERYRINKTIWQVSYIANNVRTLFGSQKDYKDLGQSINAANSQFLKKMHIIPEEMIDGNLFKNSFGGLTTVGYITVAQKYRHSDAQIFHISYWGIPQEACIALMTTDWTAAGLIEIDVSKFIDDTENTYIGCPGTDKIACAGGSVTPIPMPVEKAVKICDKKDNIIDWTFY